MDVAEAVEVVSRTYVDFGRGVTSALAQVVVAHFGIQSHW